MKKPIVTLMAVLTFSFASFANNSNGNLSANLKKIQPSNSQITAKNCTVTIKGTVDGKKIDLKIEYQADDCAAGAITIIKGVMK